MWVLATLVVTVFAEQPSTLEEYLAQPMPEYAQKLKGQAFVDYINKRQAFYTAEYSPEAEAFTRARIMDLKFLESPAEELSSDVDYDDSLLDLDEDIELPDSFDARQHWPECKSIGIIRDQSACGSCWAVASASAMSDELCVQSNSTIKVMVSDTDILTCCGSSCGNGCKGGWTWEAYRWMKREGVCTGGRFREKNTCKSYAFYPCGQHAGQPYYGPCPENSWPTPKCKKSCHFKYPKSYVEDKYFAKKTYFLPNNETLIRREIFKNGPVAAAFFVHFDFYFYRKGVYVTAGGLAVGAHAVKIIGWGREKNLDYWLVANSWNSDWGENGYFRILRGSNHCGIEERIVAGLMKFD
ncbi:papain family cysteine protease [Ancylostoma caninum]|uniref:Papain family cysteine protease n=1 Tax=Ancylostoma caninum TaxID=29170 RepID=A0A368GSJ6_ANCCA|nr:papain family cysteine protease [Ancylostoma caninum]